MQKDRRHCRRSFFPTLTTGPTPSRYCLVQASCDVIAFPLFEDVQLLADE
jgi:hypothetical protein